MVIREDEVDNLTEEAAKELLKSIIRELDSLDTEDYFGTEGWRHSFGLDE